MPNIYIVDSSSGSLWELTDPSNPSSATNLGTFPTNLGLPVGIAALNENLYIIDNSDDQLWVLLDRYNPASATLVGDFPSGLNSPQGIAAYNNRLYVVDTGDDELWTVNDPTNPGGAVGGGSEFPPGLASPSAITRLGSYFYILDNSGDELWRTASSASSSSLRGEFPTSLSGPQGITVYGGSLYVSDQNNNTLWLVSDPDEPENAVLQGSFPLGLSNALGMTTMDALPEQPASPIVTAPTFNSIRIVLSADPTSDSAIISRDIRWKRMADNAWTEVEGVTSPHTVSSGIAEQTEYEAQWRAVSALGDGAWSPSFAVTTPAAIFQTSATTDSLVQLSVSANVNLGDEPLSLSDFDDTNLITSPALVLLRSNSDPNNPRIWGRGPREVTGTELLDGEFDISPSDEPINLIQFRQDGESDYGNEQITIHDDGPLNLGTYFSSGDGNDLTLWIQTPTGVAEIPMRENYDRGGGNFAAFNVPSQYQSIISSISLGSRFIVAMTLPTKVLTEATTNSPIELLINANAVLGDAPIIQTSANANLPIELSVNANAELGNAPLLLSDFDDTALNTSPALVLLTRGDASEGSSIWGRGVREVSNSRLIDGEFDISPSNEPINQIRFRLDGSSSYGDEQISFHDNGPLDLRTYFTGDGNNLTLWIQTSTGVAEIPMGENYDRGGSNFSIFDVPPQYQFIIAGINPGDRFILAMTFPILLMTEADTNS